MDEQKKQKIRLAQEFLMRKYEDKYAVLPLNFEEKDVHKHILQLSEETEIIELFSVQRDIEDLANKISKKIDKKFETLQKEDET